MLCKRISKVSVLYKKNMSCLLPRSLIFFRDHVHVHIGVNGGRSTVSRAKAFLFGNIKLSPFVTLASISTSSFWVKGSGIENRSAQVPPCICGDVILWFEAILLWETYGHKLNLFFRPSLKLNLKSSEISILSFLNGSTAYGSVRRVHVGNATNNENDRQESGNRIDRAHSV